MRVCLSLILLAVAMVVHGHLKPTVSAYTTGQGLSSNFVRGIDEDLDGCLWVSTDNGLCLFRDPYAPEKGIVVMRSGAKTDDKHPISNDLNMIYADRREPVLWIATRGDGLDAYHYRSNTFVHYPVGTAARRQGGAQPSKSLHDASVTSITPDGDRALWLTSWMGGFTCMDKDVGLFYHFSHTNFPQLPCDSCWCAIPLGGTGQHVLSSTSEGLAVSRLLAVGHVNHGLTIIDLKTKRCRNYPIIQCFKDQYTAEDGVRTIVRDHRGNLWLGTEKGLALFDMRRHKAVEVEGVSGLVNHLSLQGDSLWIATRDMGLLSLSVSDYYNHPQQPSFHPLDMASANLSPSLGATISHTDSHGHLWIGTQEEGLLLARHHVPWFFTLRLPSAIQDNITALLALSADDVWVGTYQKGLFRWNPRSGACQSVPLVDANGGKRIFVNGLALWQGRVAVATGQGLFVVEPKTNRYHCYNRKELKLSSDYMLAVATDHWGQLWCSCSNGEIGVFNKHLRLLYRLNSKAFCPPRRAFAHLCPAGTNAMACTTGSGVLLIRQDDTGRPIIQKDADSTSVSPLLATIHALGNDAEGRLLCFTPGGIYRLDSTTLTPIYPCLYNEQQGNIHAVALLQDGSMLWYGNRNIGVMSDTRTSALLPFSSWSFVRIAMVALFLLLLAAISVFLWRRHQPRKTKVAAIAGSSLTEDAPSANDNLSTTNDSASPANDSQSLAEDNVLIRRLEETVASMDSLESLNRDSLAQEMCMSTSTLYRRMKQTLGQSPNEWIRVKRLERARALLKSGRNVSETAVLVGLDSAYLARCYKEHFGVYPSEDSSHTPEA